MSAVAIGLAAQKVGDFLSNAATTKAPTGTNAVPYQMQTTQTPQASQNNLYAILFVLIIFVLIIFLITKL